MTALLRSIDWPYIGVDADGYITGLNGIRVPSVQVGPSGSEVEIVASPEELALLDGLTAGTVTASKAVVVDANKDIGDFRNLDCVNLDAGASGVAGTVDIFPTTASKGKASLACADQTGNTTVTLNFNAMGQATQINVPDPGAASAYLGLSTAALTLAEMDRLDGALAGTVVASKAVVADANKDIGSFRDMVVQNLDAGASGIVGSVDIFPTTASKGKFHITCDDQAGDTTVAMRIRSLGQATTFHFADQSAADVYFSGASDVLTLAEMDRLDGALSGTVVASKVVVADANKDVASFRNVTLENLDAGASGVVGSVDIFPTTASKGKTQLTSSDNTGDTTTAINVGAQAAARTYTVPDAGASAKFLLTFSDTTTAVAGAATLNSLSGKVTTEALTTAGGADYTLTLTNSFIAASDMVFVSVATGTNTTEGISVQRVQPGSGQVVIVVRNTTIATALDGTLVVSFFVVKPGAT